MFRETDVDIETAPNGRGTNDLHERQKKTEHYRTLVLYVCKTKVNCTNDFTTTGTEKNWTETTQSFSSIHEEIKMTSTTQVDELS